MQSHVRSVRDLEVGHTTRLKYTSFLVKDSLAWQISSSTFDTVLLLVSIHLGRSEGQAS